MYAVIDLETTGLRPGGHDRIVEVAVIHVAADGTVTREWCTLVNPDRDLGAQHIHGIRAAEVLDAPSFAQIAGELARLLAGQVVVAHNLQFDVPFLQAEYARLGVPVPLDTGQGLCTMRLAARYLPGAARRLADCCAVAGVELTNAHSALYDARAAAGLLACYLRGAGQPPPWAPLVATAAAVAWPPLPTPPVIPVMRRESGAVPAHFLSRLVDRLPRAETPDADAYLDLLDQALLDRHISATEARGLLEFANRLALCREQVIALHERYLRALVAAALADGVVTEEEHADLTQVTGLLGLTAAHLDKALADKALADNALADKALAARHTDRPGPAGLGQFALASGDIVVFTGQFSEPREVWEERASEAGLVPAANVTKATRLVVAADPDTQSGKARTARRYRIPLVGAETFRRLAARLS